MINVLIFSIFLSAAAAKFSIGNASCYTFRLSRPICTDWGK